MSHSLERAASRLSRARSDLSRAVQRANARPRKEPTALSYGTLGVMLTWWAISNWADYADGRRGWNFVLSTIALTAAALSNYWRALQAFRAEHAKER